QIKHKIRLVSSSNWWDIMGIDTIFRMIIFFMFYFYLVSHVSSYILMNIAYSDIRTYNRTYVRTANRTKTGQFLDS
ncbi:MAG: hypothetical protein ACP5NL_07630, partial [Thermoplasmata archaeon]